MRIGEFELLWPFTDRVGLRDDMRQDNAGHGPHQARGSQDVPGFEVFLKLIRAVFRQADHTLYRRPSSRP
jgi:hypothetical protein